MDLKASGRLLEREVVNAKSKDHIEITGLLQVFPLLSGSFDLCLPIFFFHHLAVLPILFFFTPVLLYFLLPHVYSFPSPIPSYTPCPLTLNHRWTKQWPMSHSIKTNNPVMGGGLCGAGATVTRQYAHWSKQPLISDSDDTIHKWTLKAACTHTRSQPHAKKIGTLRNIVTGQHFCKKFSFLVSVYTLHSVSLPSSINGRYRIDSRY